MLSSIRNNLKRKHKTIFEGNGGMENREVRNPFVSPKNASPEELKALRKKIQQQQRKRILKAILISVLILGLLLVGILIVF